MKTLPLHRVRRALIVAPHPDDEAIGAWGMIRALRRRGARVRVVVVTNGAASHLNSILWPKRRLVAERRRETRRALHHVGVGAGDVRFLGLPDGGLAGRRWPAIARAVVQTRADLVLLPSMHDDHPDHRAVAAAAARACTPGARRLAYLVWSRARRRPDGAVYRLRLGDGGRAKRAAIARYRSQTGVIQDDPAGFAMARHELRAFSRPCELYRKIAR